MYMCLHITTVYIYIYIYICIYICIYIYIYIVYTYTYISIYTHFSQSNIYHPGLAVLQHAVLRPEVEQRELHLSVCLSGSTKMLLRYDAHNKPRHTI